MTYEEATKYLTERRRCHLFNAEENDAIDVAILAIKKQIPMKPIKGTRGKLFPYESDMAFCPICGNLAAGAFYCDWCGQALTRKEDKNDD